MATRSLAIALFVLACATGALAAAELATNAERTYGELRAAKDAKTQLMADRWYNLIRLQEWNDLSGKFTTTAKYVEHDPNLEWVKLRVIKGTGANRVVKDMQIPVAKLSKTCQSRVRQISVLSEKVVAAAAEVGKEKEADEAGATDADAAGEMMEDQGPPSDMRDGRGGPPAEGEPFDPSRGRDGRRQPPPPETAAAPPPEPAAAENREPLPAQLPPLPTPTAAAPVADGAQRIAQVAAASTDQPTATVTVAPANLPDDAPWRTSYDAFRANIKVVDGGRMGPQLDWGELKSLKRAHDLVAEFNELPESETAKMPALLEEMGEFVWEATLTDAAIEEDGVWTARLGLPELSSVVTISFLLDDQWGKQPGDWQRLKPGDKVRFIGRFLDFESTYDLLVGIRFPEDAVIESDPTR